MTRSFTLSSGSRNLAAALMVSASALALAATPASAQEVLYSSNGGAQVSIGERVTQSSGVTQIRLANGVRLSFVDAAEYRINADGTVDLFSGSVTVAGVADGMGLVRFNNGVEGRVSGSGSAASFTVGQDGEAQGHVLTGSAEIGRGRRLREFKSGEMWAARGTMGVRQVAFQQEQVVPDADDRQERIADMRDGGPLAAAQNGLPVSIGDQLAAAGASSDIVSAARNVQAAAGNPSLETFPTGDLAALVAAAGNLEGLNGGTPFAGAQADIIRAYLGHLAQGNAASNFLPAYAGFLTQYLNLIRAGALPSSFTGTGLADLEAYLGFLGRTGALANLSSQNRALSDAYLAFLASGGNRDNFAATYTDLVDAYFDFVRGGGDPVAFAGASQQVLDQYIAFLANSGLAAQLSQADQTLLAAYLENGGLAFSGIYQNALSAYFAHLASGRLPSDYAAVDPSVLRSYLETLENAGLFDEVLGAQAQFFADYLAFLQGGGNPDQYAGLNANIFAGYAGDLQAYFAFLAAGNLPSGFTGDTAALADYLAALEAAGAFNLFLGERAGFFADYLAFLQGGGEPDAFAGLNANIFGGYASALGAYYDYLLTGGSPSAYQPLSQAQIAAYVAALQAQGASGAFLDNLAAFYTDYAAYLATGADPDVFTGLPVLNLGAFADALNAYAEFLGNGGLPADFTGAQLQTLANYLNALANSGELAARLGANADLVSAYFAYLSGGGLPNQFAGLPLYQTYADALGAYFDFLDNGGLPGDYTALSAAQIQQYLTALGAAGGFANQLGNLADFYTAYFAFISSGGNPAEFAGLPVYDTYASALQAYFDFLSGGGLPADFTGLTQQQVNAYLAALDAAGGLDAQIGGAAASFLSSYFAFVAGGGDPANFAGLPIYADYVTALNAYQAFLAGGGLPGDYTALTQNQIEAYLDALAGVTGGFGAYAGLSDFFGAYYAFVSGGGDPADFAGLPLYVDYLAAIAAFYDYLAAGGLPSGYTALTQAQVQAYLAALSNAGLLLANYDGEVLSFFNTYLAFLTGGGVPDDFGSLPTGGGAITPPVMLTYAGGFNAVSPKINFITTLRLNDGRQLPGSESGFVATAYTINANGGLTAYTRTGGTTRTIGSMSLAEVSGNADALIGRWNNGTNTGANVFTLNANQGFHYALTRPVASDFALPTQGKIDYDLLGATSPTMVDGSVAPGGVTADMAILLGSPQHKIGFEAQFTMPGLSGGANETRSYSTLGGVADPAQSASTINSVNAGSFSFVVPGTSAANCATADCQMGIFANFAGDNDTLGLTYTARNDLGDGKVLIGAMLFGNGTLTGGATGGGSGGGGTPASGPTIDSYLGGFTSTAGRAYATNNGFSQPGSAAAVIATDGSLTSAGNLAKGTASAVDIAGDASGLLGRFTDGQAAFFGNVPLPVNDGLPYVVLAPLGGALPTSGTIDYEVYAATQPIFNNGESAPGTFESSLSLAFGAPTISYRMTGTIVMPESGGDVTYSFASTGYDSGAFENVINAGPGANDILLLNEVSGTGRGCAGSGSGCNISFYGSFGGAVPEERLGLVYQVYPGNFSLPRIQGAVIYAPEGTVAPAGGGGNTGGGSGGSNTSTFTGTRDAIVYYSYTNGSLASGFGGSATLENGGLTGMTSVIGTISKGTASVVEAGDNGTLAWARWTNGTVTDNGLFGNVSTPVSATGGYHVMAGKATVATTLPTSGTASYSLIGQTAATDNKGSAVGTLTGDMAIAFGSTSKVGYEFNMQVGGRGWSVATTGGSANPGNSQIVLQSGNAAGPIFGGTFNSTSNTVTATGGACATSCLVTVSGALYGAAGANAGVAVNVVDSSVANGTIQASGLAIFKSDAVATGASPTGAASTIAAADWDRWEVAPANINSGADMTMAANGIDALAARGIQFSPAQLEQLAAYSARPAQ